MSTEAPAPGDAASAGAVAPDLLLGCKELSKRFGGVLAVDGVTLEVPSAGVFGLCGFNGAGKSTLFDLLAGAVKADAGKVVLGGEDVTGLNSSQRARRGLARTWQLVRLAGNRSVLDNVAAGAIARPGQSILLALARPQLGAARARAEAVLADLGLTKLRDQLAGNLTLEAQRLTELARALAADPRVILADEPASGLSGTQRQVLSDVLRHLGSTRAVVLVEHDLELLTGIADRIWTMVSGRLAYSGDVAGFTSSDVYASLRGIVR